MKAKNQYSTLLFSAIGVVIMFVLLAAIYLITGFAKVRVDMTEENVYTLSKGTLAILKSLDTPVEVRLYATKQSEAMPVALKTYAQRVEDLLDEYRKAAGGKVTIKKYDPEPDSDAEDAAHLDGVEGQMIGLGDKIYLGLAVRQLDTKVALPFLSPERERLLEYDLSRAISRVAHPEKPVIGVMSSLPVFGQQMNPMMMRMGQQGQEPWVLISELKQDFDVRQLEMTGDAVPADIEVLLVIHPKNISDPAQYAIDQFILRGGKLIAFLDPFSIIDAQSSMQPNPLQAAASGGSNLEKLLKFWGLTYDEGKVVADMTYKTMINQQGRAQEAPAVLSLTQGAMNKEDVVTSQVDSILMPFAGAFTGTPAEGLQMAALVKTTEKSQLVDRFMAQFSGEQIAQDFSASGKEMPLALRLTGKFKSAFPEGKPKETSATPDKPEEKKEEPAGEHLKEASKEGVVILVGDVDMLHDQFSVRVQNFFGQRIVSLMNGNLSFVQSMVEQLGGDSNLIAVRSRATMSRPFVLVRKMEAEAQDRYRSEIKKLDDSLNETRQKLNQLQQSKEAGQRFILSAEQQQEIANFRKTEAQASADLKKVRKELRRDVDSLQNRLKWANILGMPALVTVGGIVLAIFKRKRTAAK